MRRGCWTAATSRSRAGSRWEWQGSTAGDWARSPTARPECSWPRSARWAGPWWTKGFICRRAGPRIKTGVRRRGFRRRGRATGQRPNWRWSCWSGPWSGDICRLAGLPGTTPSGCRRPSVRDWRHWGCAMCWTFRRALLCGRRNLSGPVRATKTGERPASQAGGRAAAHYGGAQC